MTVVFILSYEMQENQVVQLLKTFSFLAVSFISQIH